MQVGTFRNWGDVAVCVLLVTVMSAGPSYSYLAPGTGSVLLTGILGIFAAITYTLRRFFYRILRVFRPGAPERTSDDD